jgi:hypothetical protein
MYMCENWYRADRAGLVILQNLTDSATSFLTATLTTIVTGVGRVAIARYCGPGPMMKRRGKMRIFDAF